VKIAIIGMGYVGLPLAVAAAKSGHIVIGVDKNIKVVASVNSYNSHVEEFMREDYNKMIKLGKLTATSNYNDLENIECFIICVPTPLLSPEEPDLSYLREAGESLSSFIKKGAMIILESTVEPGTTRHFLLPILLNRSGLKENDIDLVFSPERIDPGNLQWNLQNTPKVISGTTDRAIERAFRFYSRFIPNLVKCSSLEVAETAKLLENSFRLLNISFINEFAKFCEKIDLNVMEVIAVASSKPYGFMAFYPSIGVGGHCIPVDPMYLFHKSAQVGSPLTMINLASQINKGMPGYFVSKATKMLGDLSGKKILVIGIAYKPNISDVRESAAVQLINSLKLEGATVDWHDEIVGFWNGMESKPITANYDLAIIATHHNSLDLRDLGKVPVLENWKYSN
jgi:UDP-N-acetyl-D-glucosamine dehydrogenase